MTYSLHQSDTTNTTWTSLSSTCSRPSTSTTDSKGWRSWVHPSWLTTYWRRCSHPKNCSSTIWTSTKIPRKKPNISSWNSTRRCGATKWVWKSRRWRKYKPLVSAKHTPAGSPTTGNSKLCITLVSSRILHKRNHTPGVRMKIRKICINIQREHMLIGNNNIIITNLQCKHISKYKSYIGLMNYKYKAKAKVKIRMQSNFQTIYLWVNSIDTFLPGL